MKENDKQEGKHGYVSQQLLGSRTKARRPTTEKKDKIAPQQQLTSLMGSMAKFSSNPSTHRSIRSRPF